MKRYEIKSRIRLINLICVVVGVVVGICLGMALAGTYASVQEAAYFKQLEEDHESGGNGVGFGLWAFLIGMPVGGFVGACLGYGVASRMNHEYQVLLDEIRSSRT